MDEDRITGSPSWSDPRGQVMKTPDDVAEMLRLKACGWGLKRIARQLGCSHHTVKDYVAAGGVKPFKSPERPKLLDGLEGWLRERFIRHRGNADVVRQDLLAEKGVAVIGPATAALCDLILEQRPHPEQGFRSCLGILRLARPFGIARLEAAATHAIEIGALTYGSVRSILDHKLDRHAAHQRAADGAPIIHSNIRGSRYYQ